MGFFSTARSIITPSLRQELNRIRPRRWKTDHSDTEVILHSFQEWGIDCLSRFRGMFAIAIWDARAREMWLIRDRIGIKPLYYTLDNGRLAFASEIKALFADPLQSREIDEESLFHYLSFLHPGAAHVVPGIQKLRPGTWLRVRPDGSVLEHRYWDVWDHTNPLIGVPEDELIERLMAELRTAIRLRKMADVPIGVFLSGGIDSSLNATLFLEGESEQVHTFTVGSMAISHLPLTRRIRSPHGCESRRISSREAVERQRCDRIPRHDGQAPGRAFGGSGLRPHLLLIQAGSGARVQSSARRAKAR